MRDDLILLSGVIISNKLETIVGLFGGEFLFISNLSSIFAHRIQNEKIAWKATKTDVLIL